MHSQRHPREKRPYSVFAVLAKYPWPILPADNIYKRNYCTRNAASNDKQTTTATSAVIPVHSERILPRLVRPKKYYNFVLFYGPYDDVGYRGMRFMWTERTAAVSIVYCVIRVFV